jgi:DNA polymerase-4
MSEALRRCPDAVVAPPRRHAYEAASESVFDVFQSYTPLVEGLSLDEAFLDVTASRGLFGDAAHIAQRIRSDIWASTGLTASAGVASSKFAAKIASTMNKPNGLTVVDDDDVAGFLGPLPIEKMWGIGPKTAPLLRQLGFATLHDLANAPVGALERALGSWGSTVRTLAAGTDPREVQPNRQARSISVECTYEEDLCTKADVARTLFGHASQVASRLTAEQLVASAIVVKIKYADFTLLTRRETLKEPASDTTTIHAASLALLARFPDTGKGVRLTGVGAHGLRPYAAQGSLFPDRILQKRNGLEAVRHAISQRFAGPSLTFASLLEDGAPNSTTRRRSST